MQVGVSPMKNQPRTILALPPYDDCMIEAGAGQHVAKLRMCPGDLPHWAVVPHEVRQVLRWFLFNAKDSDKAIR